MKSLFFRYLAQGTTLFLWGFLWGWVFAWLNWKSFQFRLLGPSQEHPDLPAKTFWEFLAQLYHFWSEKISFSDAQVLFAVLLVPFFLAFLFERIHFFLFSFLNKETGFFDLFAKSLKDLLRTRTFIIPYALIFVLNFSAFLFMTGYVQDIVGAALVVLCVLAEFLIPFGIWSEKARMQDVRPDSSWWYPVWPGYQSVLIVALIASLFIFLSGISDWRGEIFIAAPAFFCTSVIRYKIDFESFVGFITNKKTYYALFLSLVFYIFFAIVILFFFSIPLSLVAFMNSNVAPYWVAALSASGEAVPWWGSGYFALAGAMMNGGWWSISFFMYTFAALCFGRYVFLLLDHFDLSPLKKSDVESLEKLEG